MAARKLEGFGTKLIDKIMTHLADDCVEKLESFLVGKAHKHMVNVGEFCSSLIRLNVLDEHDMQLRAGLLTTDEEKWTDAIRKACSKRAFGSLVVALQSSGNERILEGIFEWLENAPKGTEYHTPSTNLDTSQAVTTNNVILREVFKNIDSIVLYDLTFVNKLWKQEALSLLRQRNDLGCLVESHGTCSSDDVQTVNDDIMRLFGPMEIAPVHGIGFNISPQGPACSSPIVLPFLDQLLDTFSLKSLSVDLSGTWLDHQNCPPFKFAKGLLQDLNRSLANLQLKITSGREEFIQLLQHCSFPSLKVLRLEEDDDATSDEAYKNYIRTLLSLAPNLEELYFSGYVNLRDNFLGDRQQEVLLYPRLICGPFIADSVLGSLRLKKLSLLLCSTLDDQYFQRFMRTLPTLLGTCCSRTLKELRVDPMIALSLMSCGVVLENVEDLHLCCSYEVWEHLEPRILQNFSKFDFTSIFPKLSNVFATRIPTNTDFEPLPHHMEELIEGVANVNARPDRAANVMYLAISGLSDQTLDFYVELFPHIRGLAYKFVDHDEVPMSIGSIWKLKWFHLDALLIIANMEMLAKEDLDSVFCGIFPEEVAELREKTDEYLKNVNIFPVKPSFTYFKNLSAFKLEYSDDVDVELACGMSKVTGLIVFARLPNLAVIITTKRPDVYEALQHMKAYASVVLSEP